MTPSQDSLARVGERGRLMATCFDGDAITATATLEYEIDGGRARRRRRAVPTGISERLNLHSGEIDRRRLLRAWERNRIAVRPPSLSSGPDAATPQSLADEGGSVPRQTTNSGRLGRQLFASDH